MGRPAPIYAWLIATVIVSTCLWAESVQAADWRKLYSEEGVTVLAKDRPGSDLPVLRGEGVLQTNLYLLLAIVDDVKRHPQWVHRLESARMLWRPDPWRARAYLRFDFPWPASDRDSIVHVEVKRRWVPHHEVYITFQNTTDKTVPPLDGVVRVPRTIGFTRLRWLGPNRTHVIYQIDADPSGSLPRWLVRWLSKKLPLRAIRGLRKQLKRKKNDYNAFRRRFDPRLRVQSDAPPTFTLPGVPPSDLAKPAKPGVAAEPSAGPKS